MDISMDIHGCVYGYPWISMDIPWISMDNLNEKHPIKACLSSVASNAADPAGEKSA